MIEIDSDLPAEAAQASSRSLYRAMRWGASQRCPACGNGALYSSYLKVADACPACGEELHHQRADDAPPYFVILIVGHFVVGGVMSLEQALEPPLWVHAVVWFPVILLSSLWMLPRVKGALIGLQWALRMHGFGGADPDAAAARSLDSASH